ncbi:MAG: hypothetical protein ACRD00_04275 [Thermoanaerobaculia bacterium]
MRLACVLVPLFPLAARLRSEPELKGEAVAVCEGNGNAARVVAASRRAREKGVRAGMTLPQARALLPGLVARGRDRESEHAAQEALLEAADAFSPRVEDAGDGVVFFDFQPPLPPGEGRGEGKTSAEHGLGERVIAAVEKAGLPSRVGIGASKLAARVAANLPDSPAVVPEGEETAFLAPLPLDRLAPELEIAQTLERWGIRSIGDFAKLPEGEVASRLGALGRALHATARGIDPRPLTPRVEDAGVGVMYLDLDGHPALRGAVGAGLVPALPPSAEHRLGRNIIAAVEEAGLPSRVGIGASKLAARVAANLPDSPAVVPDGEEAAFLAPLPLDRLAPELEIAQTLERWGIRVIGDFAKLPEGEVASRLGELGRALHATARGIDPRPLTPRVPPLVLTEGMELEWPLATLEPFLFLGHAALERLVARLEAQALACARLDVALKLDPDGHDARAIRLPAPTRDAKTLLTLVRLELEARPPGAPVAGFAFTALPDQPRRAQLALFGPAALSPDRLATTIARLAALLGADRVGSPRAVDGHRPERFALAGYAPPPPPDLGKKPAAGRGLLAVRVLRPPIPLEVESRGSDPPLPPGEGRGEGRSVADLRLLSIKTAAADASPPISGSVKVAAGPWSLEEGWWTEEPAQRDYWDVELSDGALYRIYRDRKGGAWFADGVYD